MRNMQFVNILKRLSYSSATRSLVTCSKSNNLLNTTSSNKYQYENNNSAFTQSKRYASHGSNQSDFSRSAIFYSILGASLFGITIGFYFQNSDSKKELKKAAPASTPKPASVTNSQQVENEEQEEEEEIPEQKVAAASTQKESISKPTEQIVQVKDEQTNSRNDTDKFLPEIPSHAQYLIIGGGTSAMSAFKAIRASDPTARVLIVTEERYKPYMRPPLSKDLWNTDDENLLKQLKFKQYNGNERSLFFLEDEFYANPKYLNQLENGGVAVVTGRRVNQVDIVNKTAKLDNNWEIAYDKCLIATGGRPKNLPIFEKRWDELKDKVTLFRNIEDFNRLYSIAKQGKTIAIIGGGFLGSELACAIGNLSKKHGGNVIQLFPESGNLRRILPEYLSEWATNKVRDEGVTIVPRANVVGAKLNDDKVELNLEPTDANGPKAKWLLADHVVVAVGLDANVQLASSSSLEIDPKFGGYVVNAELQARNSVWVAGDAACFYDVKLGRRRVEHHDHAVVSGRLAGENMTGAGKPYWHQSMFWSDLGPKIGFEAIGLIDSSLQTVGLFARADENDNPEALVKESNESLRSEIKSQDTSQLDAGELRAPSSGDEFGKGVILYLREDNTVVGVLLWNVFKRIPIARQLIQSQVKLTDYKEMAKLFRINATGLEESSN